MEIQAQVKEVKVFVSSDTYIAQVFADPHHYVVDEPIAAGGGGSAPDPYDYILGSLGSCTAITVAMYAKRKQWPLESVEVSLTHQRLHSDDCSHCDANNARLDEINKKIKFNGPLTREQQQRLEFISTKCPVQKTLQTGIKINTFLIEVL